MHFLACKVDKFNACRPFVGNLWGSPLGQEKALEQSLKCEPLLIQQLNYCYRAFEGFLIDLNLPPHAGESEILRKTAANFLNGVTLMDTDLSYTPSQTASPAVLSGASRVGITMKSCLSQSLMLKENRTYLSQLLDIMKSMRTLVKKNEPPRYEEVAVLKEAGCFSAECALYHEEEKRCEDDDCVSKRPKRGDPCSQRRGCQ